MEHVKRSTMYSRMALNLSPKQLYEFDGISSRSLYTIIFRINLINSGPYRLSRLYMKHKYNFGSFCKIETGTGHKT
jgi:hypothetical protein